MLSLFAAPKKISLDAPLLGERFPSVGPNSVPTPWKKDINELDLLGKKEDSADVEAPPPKIENIPAPAAEEFSDEPLFCRAMLPLPRLNMLPPSPLRRPPPLPPASPESERRSTESSGTDGSIVL